MLELRLLQSSITDFIGLNLSKQVKNILKLDGSNRKNRSQNISHS